jgi:hypothetical protein
MKAITTTLYVCTGLMIAAAIMGAVDYSSASRKGTLDKLYKEERPEVKAPPAPKEIGIEDYSRGEINPSVETVAVKAPEKKMAKKATAKVARKKKKITYKEFSRKAIREEIVMVDSVIAKK